MDGGAWQAMVHGVAKSWAGLSDFTSLLGSGKLRFRKVQCLALSFYSGEDRTVVSFSCFSLLFYHLPTLSNIYPISNLEGSGANSFELHILFLPR